MSSHLLWFKLSHGRVWHVACSGAQVALCGQSIPARGERQPKRPPFGARPCPDCHSVSIEAREALATARLAQGKVMQPAPGPLVTVSHEVLEDAVDVEALIQAPRVES